MAEQIDGYERVLGSGNSRTSVTNRRYSDIVSVEGASSSPEVRAGTVRRCAVRRALPVVLAVVMFLAVAGCSSSDGVSQDVGLGPVPDDVVALIDQWKQATESSMVDLYTANGYHLYGDQKFSGDEIGPHLVNPAYSSEELTPLLLVAGESGRYVVTQGVENSVGSSKYPSGVSWEIVTDSDGTLKIAQSAWLYVNS
jgi:hypothetical protein